MGKVQGVEDSFPGRLESGYQVILKIGRQTEWGILNNGIVDTRQVTKIEIEAIRLRIGITY